MKSTIKLNRGDLQNDARRPELYQNIVLQPNKKFNKEVFNMKFHDLIKEIEDDIYNEEGVASYEEDDVINSAEAGFMIGYLSA